jgi:hypothetical protein
VGLVGFTVGLGMTMPLNVLKVATALYPVSLGLLLLVAKALKEYSLFGARAPTVTAKAPAGTSGGVFACVTPGPPMVGSGLTLVRELTTPRWMTMFPPSLVRLPPRTAVRGVTAVAVGLITVGAARARRSSKISKHVLKWGRSRRSSS